MPPGTRLNRALLTTSTLAQNPMDVPPSDVISDVTRLARFSYLRSLVSKGREQALEKAANCLHHADGRDGHEGLHLTLFQHLQDVGHVPVSIEERAEGRTNGQARS